MECFDYIQLGRAFGTDYGKCLLRIDAAKVRFSRWGEANGVVAKSQLHDCLRVSEKDFRLAQSLLQQIQDSFEDAERKSRRYQNHATSDESTRNALIVYNENQDLSTQDAQIHSRLRTIASQRQNNINIIQKTRWALYDKKKFDTMISEVVDFVDRLVDLFPNTKDSQITLCAKELSTIEDARGLMRLRDVVGADDPTLQRCAEAELAHRGHVVTGWKVGDEADVWVGDENGVGVESKGHHASNFSVSGSAKLRLGNNNKGQ